MKLDRRGRRVQRGGQSAVEIRCTKPSHHVDQRRTVQRRQVRRLIDQLPRVLGQVVEFINLLPDRVVHTQSTSRARSGTSSVFDPSASRHC